MFVDIGGTCYDRDVSAIDGSVGQDKNLLRAPTDASSILNRLVVCREIRPRNRIRALTSAIPDFVEAPSYSQLLIALGLIFSLRIRQADPCPPFLPSIALFPPRPFPSQGCISPTRSRMSFERARMRDIALPAQWHSRRRWASSRGGSARAGAGVRAILSWRELAVVAVLAGKTYKAIEASGMWR